MKSKKLLIALLTVLIVLTSIVAVACPKPGPDPREPGAETGTYYYDAADGQYLLTLSEGVNFTLVMGSENKSGTFTIDDNGNMTFAFTDGSSASNIRYLNDTVTLTYQDVQMVFRRKVNYTVTFNTMGGGDIDSISVLNGKTIDKPQDPIKENYAFMGWYKEMTFKTPFAFETEAVTGDLTLYAKWVPDDPSILDFTIDFDLNYEGAVNPESVQTIGGKLYETHTPTRVGYNFAGWWVSMYEDGTKLSYKFNENLVFTEDTTLFALWTTGNVNILPDVSSTKVTWNGISGITSYSVSIADSEGNVVLSNPNIGTASYNVDWSALPAGDYVVTVTAGANTGVRYYKNKALSRVSLFSVTDQTVLNFNEVANAEKYYLTIVCGDESHAHDMYDIGNSTSYDFASCPMVEGGIKFNVTAAAEGFASSTSRTFVVEKTLAAIELNVDEATEVVSWDEVEFATNYIVSVICENAAHNHSETANNLIDNGAKTSYSYKECSGNVVINVYPVAKGYNSPVAASAQIAKQTLATPSGIKVIGTVISWNAVEGAQSYELIVDGETIAVNGTQHDLAEVAGMQPGDEFSVQVIAKGANDSLPSDEVAVLYDSLFESISYANNTVYWKHVVGAEYYEVTVNGQALEQPVVGANSVEVELTQAGENTISVSYYNAQDVKSEEVTIAVQAYTITLNNNNGEEATVVYRATGDKANLPVPVRNGYDFNGWYDVAGGGAELGTKFMDETFTLSEDLELFAFWKANVYRVTYVYDNDVELTSPEGFEVTYGETFDMPTPTPLDKKFAFVAWTTKYEELSTRVTDEFGRSVKSWDIYDYDDDGEIKLYPYWIEAFIFTYREADNAYTVSQNATGIQIVSNVTVPYTYDDDKIVDILGDFSNCTNLREIEIPNTIQTMNVTSLDGCVRLIAVNVYAAPSNYITGPYSSESGILIKTDNGVKTLDFVPLGLGGPFTVPSTISEIASGAFEGRAITEVTIPSTVTLLRNGAFRGSRSLTSVTFEQGGSNSLAIQREAFADCTSLTEVTLPARFTLSGIGSETVYFPDLFIGCTSLERVNVDTGHPEYSSSNGIVTSRDSRTLVYYPMAREVEELSHLIRFIGEYAFYGNISLTEMTLSDDITHIGNYAFAQCPNLTTFVTGNGVKFIGNYAFSDDKMLKSIDVGTQVESIGDYAFVGSNRLVHVNVDVENSRLATIGEYAFYECNSLYDIGLPNSINKVGKYAFYGCSILSEVKNGGTYKTAPDEYTGIDDYAFAGCRSLSSIAVPASVARIGSYAFTNCYRLASVFMPDSLKVIGSYAFYCDRDGSRQSLLSYIELGNNLKKIEGGAFAECSNLVSVKLPASLEQIASDGDPVLDANGNQKTEPVLDAEGNPTYDDAGNPITRPVTHTVGAFEGCSGLIMVYNFSTLNVVQGSNTFGEVARYAEHLITDENDTSVRLVTAEGGFVFYVEGGVTKLINYVGGESTVVLPDDFEGSSYIIDDGAFQNSVYITNVIISDGVTSIGANAFSGCTSLISFTVGANVESIGNNAFSGCSILYEIYDLSEHITVTNGSGNGGIAANAKYIHTDANDESKMANVDGYIFDTKNGEYYLLRYTGTDTDIVLPDEVNGESYAIDKSSFSGLTITSIVFGAGVKAIPDSLFENNTTITSVTVIGNGETTIGKNAFYAFPQHNITSIHIGSGVKSIGDFAFYSFQSNKLAELTFEEGVESIGKRAFYTTINITSLTLPASLKYIGEEAFIGAYNSKLTQLTVRGDGTCEIANKAFYEHPNIVDFSMEGIKKIGSNAFAKCKSISKVVIPDTVTDIGASAFSGCEKLADLTIGGGVTTVGSNAFQNCPIETAIFKEGITTIPNNMFAGCNTLAEVAIPEGVLTIGTSAFEGCTGLLQVNISSTVNTIGNRAFYGCNSLVSVIVGESVASVGTDAFTACADLVEVYDLSDSIEVALGSSNYGNLARNAKIIRTSREEFSVYEVVDGFMFTDFSDIGGDVVLKGYKGKETLLILPDFRGKRYVIADSAFVNNTSITGVIIPGTVRKIGAFAFAITDDFGVSHYGESSSIRTVILTNGIEEIGESAFNRCSKLAGIKIPGSIKKIGANAFRLCGSLAYVDMREGVETIGNNAFEECTGVAFMQIPDSVKTIGSKAFYNWRGLISIVLGKGVTSVGSEAFGRCELFETVYFNGTREQYRGVSGIPGNIVFLPNWEFVNGLPVAI